MKMLVLILFIINSALLGSIITSSDFSVSHDGIVCPCFSYYNLPDYDCLLERLNKNQTLPPLCVRLMQAMDDGHKFKIVKSSDGFQCNHHKVYQYTDEMYVESVETMESDSKIGGVKILLQKGDCERRFENAQMYSIVAQKKKFYQVIAKNLELLNLKGISCMYELIILRARGQSHNDACNIETLFSTYASNSYPYWECYMDEYFSYKNLQMNSIGDYFMDSLGRGVGVGTLAFVHPSASSENLSPGNFLINKKKLSDDSDDFLAGHAMRFSCQWGGNSSYKSSTTTCSKETYHDQVNSYNSKQKMIASAWHTIEISWMFQRVFNNAIIIAFYWTKPRDRYLTAYETQCRFFNTEDTWYHHQDEFCARVCGKMGKNCSECWNDDFLDGCFSPSLTIFQQPNNGTNDNLMVITIQTNHQNITFENGSFHPIPNHGSHFYHIYQYDYIFGSHYAYMSEDQNSEMTCDPHNDYAAFFHKSVILHGKQKLPTDLSQEQLRSLGAVCRVRSIFSGNSVSEWTNAIWPPLNKNIFTTSFLSAHCDCETNHWTQYYKVRKNDTWNNIDIREWKISYRNLQKNHHQKNKVYIFKNELFNRKYVFFKNEKANKDLPTASSNRYILKYGYIDDEYQTKSTNLTPSFVHAESEPIEMACADLHPFLLWTEKVKENQFRLIYVNVEKGSGKPVGLLELTGDKVCACSPQKYLTSASFDMIYRNMTNPERIEVVIVCGLAVCLYDIKTEKSKKMNLSYGLENETILHIKVDQNFVFLVLVNDTRQLHIVPIRHSVLDPEPFFKNRTQNPRIFKPFRLFPEQCQKIERIANDKKSVAPPCWYLPIPFMHCMEPYIVQEQTSARMADNSSILINAVISWDTECNQFNQPSVAVDIDYAKLPDYMRIQEDPGIGCKSLKDLKDVECKSLPTFVLHGQTTFTANISDILTNKYYLIEIRLKAAIYKECYDIWYAGSPVDPRQTFRYIIHTQVPRYVIHTKTDIPGYIWALLSVILTILGVLAVSGIFYRAYVKKMYIYKYLNRISATDIHKEEKLGEGNFGEVWKATLGKNTIVIKMLKESATEREEKEFREEALLLSKFSCDYIIRTVGICLQSRPIMLALEFVNGGSLDHYLKRDETRSKLCAGDLLEITEQVLKACIYLEQEGYIHRDIASRNCLVATVSGNNIKPRCIKLSDFGLAKDIGAEPLYRSRDPDADTLPIPWTAPESFSGRFSPKSDVWAFGVLIWEIFSWAATPYRQCSSTSNFHICPMHQFTHNEIEFNVCAKRKNLLSFPDPCTASFCDALKALMGMCWQFATDERPSFKQLQKYLNCAREEILKIDIKSCFKQLPHDARGASDAFTKSSLNQPNISGREKIKITQAYRDTIGPHDERENPFGKHLSTDVEDEETLELLPLHTDG